MKALLVLIMILLLCSATFVAGGLWAQVSIGDHKVRPNTHCEEDEVIILWQQNNMSWAPQCVPLTELSAK